MQLPVMAWEWDFLPVLTWEWDFITNVGMGMRLSPYWYGNEITSSSMRIIFSGMGMRLSPYWHGNEITSSSMHIIFSGMGMRLSPVQAWEWDSITYCGRRMKLYYHVPHKNHCTCAQPSAGLDVSQSQPLYRISSGLTQAARSYALLWALVPI